MLEGFFLEQVLGARVHALTLEKLPSIMPFPGVASLGRWPSEPFISLAKNSHSLL